MIKFEYTSTWGFRGALRGMRNPMNSWDKADSGICDGEGPLCNGCSCTPEEIGEAKAGKVHYVIGPNDLKLAKHLIESGPEHRKFLRQIFVSVDITAPLYWWKEFDTYKIGTVSNSCSTMHKIHAKEFEFDDFSCEKLTNDTLHVTTDGQNYTNSTIDCFKDVIDMLNTLRDKYNETKDPDIWYQMIQLLPTSYNQKRTITMNYENLLSIYHQRNNHKLEEWSFFCHWIISQVPYMKDFILDI